MRVDEVVSFGVGEEAIDTAGDVTDVKGHRRKTVGLRVKVVLAEAKAPMVDVFRSEIESVEDGEVDGGEVFFAATEPGFGLFWRSHDFVSLP